MQFVRNTETAPFGQNLGEPALIKFSGRKIETVFLVNSI